MVPPPFVRSLVRECTVGRGIRANKFDWQLSMASRQGLLDVESDGVLKGGIELCCNEGTARRSRIERHHVRDRHVIVLASLHGVKRKKEKIVRTSVACGLLTIQGSTVQ